MLSAEELQLRYELHDRIVQQTGNFRWLQFGHFDPTSQSITAAHPSEIAIGMEISPIMFF